MAYSKISFHTGTPCQGCTGMGEMWRRLNEAGIPFGIYSVDNGGIVGADGLRYQQAKWLIYRDTSFDYVPYHAAATAEAGRNLWAQAEAELPPEVKANKGRIWIEMFNEPSKEETGATTTEMVAAWQYHTAQAALARGYKFCGPGWAAGTPEPSAWRGTWMRRYLELCAAKPEQVAVTLHEYSYNEFSIMADYPYQVGRFLALFGACDEMGIARPTVFITELGWTLDNMPQPSRAMEDINTVAALYAGHPQIKAAFLWSLIGSGDKVALAQRLNGLIEPVTKYTLNVSWPDPPPPPTPTEETMLIDLSKWNGALDAAKAKQSGITGVILRASYGVTRDEMVTEYAARLKAAGIPVIGCYHYYHPWQSWQPQLETFVAACRAVGARRGYLDLEDMRFSQVAALEQMDDDAPPAVLRAVNAAAMRNLGINPDAASADDLYEPGLEAVALSAAQPQLVEAARQFMAGLATALPLPAGKRHGIYSNYSYIGAILGNAAWMAQFDLWLAAWTIAAAPAVPAPWSRWVLWQYSNSGNGPAYGLQSARVDLNRFNGTTAQYAEWLKIEDAPVDVAAAIRARAAEQPGAGWNPQHALPLAIIRDGYLPVGPEFDVTAGGVAYRGLRAFDRTGKMWIYYAPVPRWSETARIAA